MSIDEHLRKWKLGGQVGKRFAVVDIGYSGEARCDGGRLGGLWARDGFCFFCYGINSEWAGLAGRNKSDGHLVSTLLSPYVKFNEARLLLGFFLAGAEILSFESVCP